MGLQPLEFSDCLTDSPFFRTKLTDHERELERTSKAIKSLIYHGKQVFVAAKQLSKAQRMFAKDLSEFNFEFIDQQTDDEITIGESLKDFSKYITDIESERDRMITISEEQFVKRLELFRKENLIATKEEKKNFDKQTAKFCQSQERYLNMKTKTMDSVLKETDAQLDMEKRGFYQASMRYVLKLQEVQEKKKFEFVEILLGYMHGWLNFYHMGYEHYEEFKQNDTYLRFLLQKTRESFDTTRESAVRLMSKMLDTGCSKSLDQSDQRKGFSRQGYMYLLEKKALTGTTWTKYYCQYRKESKQFFMILYNQMVGKCNDPEKYTLESCVRRATDSIERRFCFDITIRERLGMTLTFQALSDEDRRLWLDAMDGKEPIYFQPIVRSDDTVLDDLGFNFIRKSISAIEMRGLHEQGLYRMVGVNSKVTSLLKSALDPKKADKVNLEDCSVLETKTITSAIKNYLRSLPEPLMTFKLHEKFIKAAKQELKTLRILDAHKHCHQLPSANFDMLDCLIEHLQRVASKSGENKMTVANLGVCFGPCLMRPEEETMASIMDIKFCNIIVELLINNYHKIFKSPPDEPDQPDGDDCVQDVVVGSKVVQSSLLTNPSTALHNHIPCSPAPDTPGQQIRRQTRTIYANQAALSHPSQVGRSRPVHMFNMKTREMEASNASSSSESLNSSSSKGGFCSHSISSTPLSVPLCGEGLPVHDMPQRSSNDFPICGSVSVSALTNRFSMQSDLATFVKKRLSDDHTYQATIMDSSVHSLGGSQASLSSLPSRTVMTRFRCLAGHETELSFEANQLIYNVRKSREPGWLEGEIDGVVGLVPENYVEYVNDAC